MTAASQRPKLTNGSAANANATPHEAGFDWTRSGVLENHMAKEALRYLQNAREILKSAPIEDDIYVDVKPVREALGTAYLAVLEAINESLLKRGVAKKDLPKSVEGYRKALQKHLVARNGKLLREFESLSMPCTSPAIIEGSSTTPTWSRTP